MIDFVHQIEFWVKYFKEIGYLKKNHYNICFIMILIIDVGSYKDTELKNIKINDEFTNKNNLFYSKYTKIFNFSLFFYQEIVMETVVYFIC